MAAQSAPESPVVRNDLAQGTARDASAVPRFGAGIEHGSCRFGVLRNDIGVTGDLLRRSDRWIHPAQGTASHDCLLSTVRDVSLALGDDRRLLSLHHGSPAGDVGACART